MNYNYKCLSFNHILYIQNIMYFQFLKLKDRGEFLENFSEAFYFMDLAFFVRQNEYFFAILAKNIHFCVSKKWLNFLIKISQIMYIILCYVYKP